MAGRASAESAAGSAGDLIEEVVAVVVDTLGLEGEESRLSAQTALLDSMPDLDSMAVVELVVALEERFGMEVDDDDLSGDVFETVGSLASFVAAQRRP